MENKEQLKETSDAQAYLGKIVTVTMDRPLGSKHPKYGFEYPVNYGFVPNTRSADGEELDAYIFGNNEPLETFTGLCLAVIHRLNDDDDKLVIVSEGAVLSDEDIRAATNFQEQYCKSEIIRQLP